MRLWKNRSKRPLVLIDIAVPRDIDADVSQSPGVSLYDLDVLEEYLGVCLERSAQQIPQAAEYASVTRELFDLDENQLIM